MSYFNLPGMQTPNRGYRSLDTSIWGLFKVNVASVAAAGCNRTHHLRNPVNTVGRHILGTGVNVKYHISCNMSTNQNLDINHCITLDTLS